MRQLTNNTYSIISTGAISSCRFSPSAPDSKQKGITCDNYWGDAEPYDATPER